MRGAAAALIALAWLVVCILAAAAHEADAPFADWFMSLRQPDNPLASCCGPADQFYVDEYRPSEQDPGGFVAVVAGEPIEVPAAKVIWDRVNPTGRGVIFLSRREAWSGGERFVFCFVPGAGA